MSVFPIREISTYTGRNWTIRARVTSKSQMRTFSNDRGNGKVFSVDLLDKDGGEIKASFFNGSADKFFDTIEAGKVYTLAKGSVKVANKRFSSSKHNYEINFDADAVITAVEEDDNSIDSIKFSFVKIRDIGTKHLPCTVDLVGVVKEFKSIGKITPKNSSEELTRRTITIVDSSDCAIDITLWQDAASKLDESVLASKPVVAIKGLSVKEYNGSRTCSTMQQTLIEVVDAATNKDETVKEVLAWWSAGPSVGDVHNLSASQGGMGGNVPGSEQRGRQQTITSIADMKEECKRGFFGDKGVFFDVVAKLSFVNTKSKDGEVPIHYSACSTCNRKLSEDGTNRCFGCDKTIAAPKMKYLLRAQFVDHSDQAYLSVFDAQALTILKRPVETVLQAAKLDTSSVGDELKKSYFETTYLLRVKATAQEYKGEMRPRVTVISADPVESVSMGNKLLKKIIEKIGKETLPPLTSVPEKMESEESSAFSVPTTTTSTTNSSPTGDLTMKENEPVKQEDEPMEEPEVKKMRMMNEEDSSMAIESKE